MATGYTVFEAIGTHWDVQIQEPVNDQAWKKLLKNIHTRIELFDTTYSRFRSDSLVAGISRKPGTYPMPEDGFKLMRFYERLYDMTEGKITPLVGQTISDAGYDADYSFKSKTLTDTPRWREALSFDEKSLTVTQPVILDFGAAGKGYLVDILGEMIEATGIESYLINAGGDIIFRSKQHKELSVGLENPLDTSEALGSVAITNQSICASSGSKRKWKGFHHIIDPITQKSPHQIIATWVIAKDTMIADGLATALFFTKPEELSKEFTFSYATLNSDMSLQYAKDFPVTLFR